MDLFFIQRLFSEMIDAVLLFYASYWALVIRRASAVPLYRNQSLGLFLIGFSSAVGSFSFVLTGGGGNTAVLAIEALSFVFFFYWVDATMRASRRSDPLLRDTLGWSRLRMVVWPLTVILGLLGPLLVFPVLAQGLLAYGVGALALPLAAKRSGDMTLRRHLKWFGSYAIFVVIFFIALGSVMLGIIPTNSSVFSEVVYFVILGVTLASGYSLYRSATSLVPLRQLPEGVRVQG